MHQRCLLLGRPPVKFGAWTSAHFLRRSTFLSDCTQTQTHSPEAAPQEVQIFTAGDSLLSFEFYLFIYLFIYLETECKRGRGREREGDTKSKAGSRLRAARTEPYAGLEPTHCEIMT